MDNALFFAGRKWIIKYTAHNDKLQSSCFFSSRQELQDFPDNIQVSLHKNNKISSSILQELLKILFLYMRTSSTPFK
jgi:hypothetical protein